MEHNKGSFERTIYYSIKCIHQKMRDVNNSIMNQKALQKQEGTKP